MNKYTLYHIIHLEQVANEINLSPATVTSIVDRLEAKQLVILLT